MATAGSRPGRHDGATDGKESYYSSSYYRWLPDWVVHRTLQRSGLSWRFESASSATVCPSRIRLSGTLQSHLYSALSDYFDCSIRSSNIEPISTLESSP